MNDENISSQVVQKKAIALPEGEYANYLATLAANIADEKIRQRETRWRALSGVVVAALALFGFVNINSFQNHLSEKVNEITNKKIDEIYKARYETLRKEVDSKIAYAQLINVASTLSTKTSISAFDKNSVVAILRDNSKIFFENGLLLDQPLELILDAFIMADLGTEIDVIDSELRSVIEKNESIVLSLIQYYGQRVLGEIQLNESDIERFKHYAQVARNLHSIPEVSAPFELSLDLRQNGRKSTSFGKEILRDVSHLSSVDASRFFKILDMIVNAQFSSKPTGKSERIRENMQSVIDVYKTELEQLRSKI